MMKARIMLFLSFLLVCKLCYGQQAGFPLRFWGHMAFSGNVNQPVRKIAAGLYHSVTVLQDSTILVFIIEDF